MARYNTHPARAGEEYRDKRLGESREVTLEQIKEQQRLKKLKKKRRR